MPIARFQMPDGRVARFEVPEGTTPEQAQTAFAQFASQQQDSAPQEPQSDPRLAAAQAAMAQYPTRSPEQESPGILDQIGQLFTGSDRETRATQELPELQNSGLLNGLEIPAARGAAVAAALSTMTDPAEIAKTLQSLSPEIGIQQDEKGNLIAANNQSGVRTVINKPGFSGLDALQALGLGAAFAPTGRAASAVGGGALRQAAALGGSSALTQAAIEAGQSAAGGEFNPEEVAAAGALGGAVPLATGAVGSTVDAARQGIAALRGEAGGVAPIVQAAKANNIPLMTSDIAPPNTPIGQLAQRAGERIPYAGTGGLRATQQDARKAAIQQLGDAYPAPKPDQIISSLKAQTSRIKQAAAQRYDEIIPVLDKSGPVKYDNTIKAIDDGIAALKKKGVVTSDDAIRELEQFRTTLGSADQTYSTLKENRTAFRDVVNAYDAPGRSQLPTRAKSMLSKVYGAITQDMDDAARGALSPRDFNRLKEANAIYASEAEKLTKTRLKNVLDKGDLTPEVAESLLFSQKRSEVQSLYNSLDTSGRDALRASLVQRAIAKAGGIENVSPDKFLNEMTRLQTQTGVVFKGDQKKQLQGLKEVLAATKRAGQIGITNTGQESSVPLTAAALGSAIGSLPATLAVGATAGGLARVYESAPVRNMLIRIGSAPSSSEGKRLALQVARELNGAVQSARAQATEEQALPQTQLPQR